MHVGGLGIHMATDRLTQTDTQTHANMPTRSQKRRLPPSIDSVESGGSGKADARKALPS